jgi:hypothetical protein
MAVATSVAGNIQVTKTTLAQPYLGVEPLVASSGNKANAIAAATLTPMMSSHIVYLCGLMVTGSGASNHLTVPITVTGLMGGALDIATYTFEDDLNANQPLTLYFDPPLRAAAANTPVKVSCPASGLGGLSNTVFIWGYCSTVELT